ncbi:unnamed protein product [Macrosiphum euphorbiae]|uniref:Uncharacterized protein n=1 Tax=Macrosiphum euphorbiae TaxID=13131 RepID=A0AAV0XBA6_9HEMI|nr:unnamed protein product [Macrosiphum euphorbiae]
MRPLCTGRPPYFSLILTPYQNNDDTTSHPRSDRGLYLWSRVFTIVKGVKYFEGLCWKFRATADKYTSPKHFYSSKFVWALGRENLLDCSVTSPCLRCTDKHGYWVGVCSVVKYYDIFLLTPAMGDVPVFATYTDSIYTAHLVRLATVSLDLKPDNLTVDAR